MLGLLVVDSWFAPRRPLLPHPLDSYLSIEFVQIDIQDRYQTVILRFLMGSLPSRPSVVNRFDSEFPGLKSEWFSLCLGRKSAIRGGGEIF